MVASKRVEHYGAALAAIGIAFGFASTAIADDYWQLRSEHITVVSNKGAKECIKITRRVRAFEQAIADLAQMDSATTLPPLTIYSLSEKDARRLLLSDADMERKRQKDRRVVSKFLPGPNHNVAAMISSTGDGDLALLSILNSYGPQLLSLGIPRNSPLWYQTGIANLVGGLEIHDDGSILVNRYVMFSPSVDGASTKVKYDLARTLNSDRQSLATPSDVKQFGLRAREWALLGMLTGTERRSQYRELAARMARGESAESALQNAYGASLEQMDKELQGDRWQKRVDLKIAAQSPRPTLPAATPLEPGQLTAMFAQLTERVNGRQ